MKKFALIAVVFCFVGFCSGASVDKDLVLTKKQKMVLDQFKEVVKGRLPHEYMYDDLYLIRWLRAKNFRIKDAEAMLMQNIIWRKQNNMDEILKEDWSEYRKMYKYWIDGNDKEGRPIVFVDVGEWDLRKAVVTGQAQRVQRYIDHIYEEINLKLREMRSQGKNVTQYYLLYDMDGFNLATHGCGGCIPISTRIVSTYENFYPGTNHKIVFANTPGPFQTLLQILKPLMTPSTRDSLFVYGKKEEAKAALLKDIASDQLVNELGGTREIPNYLS